MTNILKFWLLGISCLMGIVFVWIGFDTTKSKVQACTASVTKYVTAEFSEWVTSACTDYDGNLTTCTETEYWSEPASEVWSSATVNGNPTQGDYNGSMVNGVFHPNTPPRYEDMSRIPDFDNFKTNVDTSLEVSVSFLGELDFFTQSIRLNEKCISMLGELIVIDTWYGIKYSSDFYPEM